MQKVMGFKSKVMKPHMPGLEEGRKLVTFVNPTEWNFTSQPCPLIHEDCQGWTNSDTWCFNLYFFQESQLGKAFAALRRKDGTFNIDRVMRLFNQAQRELWMEQVDEDCTGEVNVSEIINNWITEHP